MQNAKLNRCWLWFGLTSLLLANLMALVLVLSKMPLLPASWGLEQVFPWALVFHVNLSIVVWALSMAGLLWMRYLPSAGIWIDRCATGLSWIAALGWFIALAFEPGKPLLSNYIPTLDTPLYQVSLGLFVTAVLLLAVSRLIAVGFDWRSQPLPQQALLLAIVALVVSIVVLLTSGAQLSWQQLNLDRAELLFWGVGHSLQAVYLLLLLFIDDEATTKVVVGVGLLPTLLSAAAVGFAWWQWRRACREYYRVE